MCVCSAWDVRCGFGFIDVVVFLCFVGFYLYLFKLAW